MEALSERSAAVPASEAAASPQKQLKLLQSACHSLTGGDSSRPLAMPRRPRADHDDADAFFEYDVEDVGTASAATTVAGGCGSGGADTGCAVTSPVDGSFDLSMSSLPLTTTVGGAAATCGVHQGAGSAPVAAHPPIPIPARSNGRRHSNGTGGQHRSPTAGPAASNGRRGDASGAAAVGQADAGLTSPHVQQSPSERVDAWLRACPSDSSASADDEFGTPEEDILTEDMDYGTPQFHVEMDICDEVVEVGDGREHEAQDPEAVNVQKLLFSECCVFEGDAEELVTTPNGARPNGGTSGAAGEKCDPTVLEVTESSPDGTGVDRGSRVSADGGEASLPSIAPSEGQGGSGKEQCVESDQPQVSEDAGVGEDAGAVDGDAIEEGSDADAASVSANSSEFMSPDALKRSCSLKSGKTPPCTPGRKKFVRFADAMGLDLQRVHTFRDEVPTVPAAAFRGLDPSEAAAPAPSAVPPQPPPTTFRMSFSSGSAAAGGIGADDAHCPHLVPMFLQPGGSRSFTDQLHRGRVRLETVVCRDGEWAVRGVVRVLNMDFHKAVRVRYTLDDWKTEREVDGLYVQGSCDGLSDRFSFRLEARGLSPGGQLQFAVCFSCRGETFWDNNEGRNYVVQLHDVGASRPYSCSPPSDWTDGRY